VGQGAMLNHLAGLVQQAQQQMQQQVCNRTGVASSASHDHVGSSTQSEGVSRVDWTRLECALYAANVVLNRPSPSPFEGTSGTNMAAAAAADVFPVDAVSLVVDACVTSIMQHEGAVSRTNTCRRRNSNLCNSVIVYVVIVVMFVSQTIKHLVFYTSNKTSVDTLQELMMAHLYSGFSLCRRPQAVRHCPHPAGGPGALVPQHSRHEGPAQCAVCCGQHAAVA
jgi:hypothetical protein